MLQILKFSLVYLLLITSMPTQAQLVSFQDPMMPHPVELRGPWFEGWYYRLTDPEKNLSVAVIGTSAYQNGRVVPGYAAIILHLPGETKTRSYENLPPHTSNWVGVKNGKNEFVWDSHGNGQLTSKEVQFKIDHVQVSMSVETRTAWGDFLNSGPAGLAHHFSFLPLQWYVDNTAGKAKYKVTYQEGSELKEIEGRGFIHQEKNWGQVFPKAWMWVQSISPQGDASIALAGGDVDLYGLTINTFLVGYRSRDLNLNFNLANDISTQFKKKVHPCDGSFELIAEDMSYRLHLKAKADPAGFTYVSIPTESGYMKDGGIESFQAVVDVEIFKKSRFSGVTPDNLIAKKSFPLSALEFGGTYMNEPSRKCF